VNDKENKFVPHMSFENENNNPGIMMRIVETKILDFWDPTKIFP